MGVVYAKCIHIKLFLKSTKKLKYEGSKLLLTLFCKQGNWCSEAGARSRDVAYRKASYGNSPCQGHMGTDYAYTALKGETLLPPL